MELRREHSFRTQNILNVFATSCLFLILSTIQSLAGQTSLAMHGGTKYDQNFPHFSYVNPDAPIGGTLHLSAVGSYNSLNPFIIKGVPAQGLGLIYQSLLSRSRDEPFSLYANIAKSFEIAPDRKWIIFSVNEKAQFSDGTPVTADDILFSFETLRKSGRPNHRQYYANVQSTEILEEARIKFSFIGDNIWEMPLIMGLMPILSKAYYQSHEFDRTSLEPPLGSGPYTISKLEAGRQISYQRNADFWGWHLPQFKGRYNFSHIVFDYFRDSDVALEAFKSGEIDVRFETDPGKWFNSLKSDPTKDLSFIKVAEKLQIPAPMKAMVFNTRRELFKNIRTRKALSLAFDFEWTNKALLYGGYDRTNSFFQNSSLASAGLPSQKEVDLLDSFRHELPQALFETAFSAPKTDGSGRNRQNLKAARSLLEKSGWVLQNGQLRHATSGKKFQFEILVRDSRNLKILSAFQKNLGRLGINVTLRTLDTASYQNRLTNFDFDMMIASWGQSLSPGNEQSFYWSSGAADSPGSRNYPGIKLSSVDHLISLIKTAPTKEDLETAVHALDRTLLSGHYVIPLFHLKDQWIAHWPHIMLPIKTSFYGSGLDVWWHTPIDEQQKKTP